MGEIIMSEIRIPEKYEPIGPAQYFWLSVLFTIPVIGFIFLIGIPLQVLEVLWTFFRSILRKFKESLKKKKSNQ